MITLKGLKKDLADDVDGIILNGTTVTLSEKVLDPKESETMTWKPSGTKAVLRSDTTISGLKSGLTTVSLSLMGTGSQDTIDVDGSNMTVKGGRGNDYITLGAAGQLGKLDATDPTKLVADDFIVSYDSDK